MCTFRREFPLGGLAPSLTGRLRERKQAPVKEGCELPKRIANSVDRALLPDRPPVRERDHLATRELCMD